MITRRAILSAFEVITNDKEVRSVTIFVGLEKPFCQIERVRATRVFKGKQEFRVMFGRCNYTEREFLKNASKKSKKLPKVMISGWPKRKKVAS